MLDTDVVIAALDCADAHHGAAATAVASMIDDRVALLISTAAIARDAARCRSLNVSLADGFALATATARSASVATFDRVKSSEVV